MSILGDKDLLSVDISQDSRGLVQTATARSQRPRRSLDQLAQEATPDLGTSFYNPETLGDISEVQRGAGGDVFSQEFGRGLLGFVGYSKLNPAEKERMELSAANYTQKHGVKSFFYAMGGGMISDAPTDIALAFTGVGLLGTLNKVVKAGKASKGVIRTRNALQKIEDAYTGAGGTMGSRLLTRTTTEFAVGATAAAINDTIIREVGGKKITAGDTLDRMLMEGAAGMFFGEILRGVGKSAGFLKTEINKSLPEDMKLDSESQIQEMLDHKNKSPEEVEGEFKDAIDRQESAMRGEASMRDENSQGPVQLNELDAEMDAKSNKTRLLNRDEDGQLSMNREYTGNIREAAAELNARSDTKDLPSTKVINALIDNIHSKSYSKKIKTQIDRLLDIPVRRLTKTEELDPGLGGNNASRDIKDSAGNFREVYIKGVSQSRIRVRGEMGNVETVRTMAHEMTHAFTVLEIRLRFEEVVQTLGKKRIFTGKDGRVLAFGSMNDPVKTREAFDLAGIKKSDPIYVLNEAYAKAMKEKYDGTGFDGKNYGFLNLKEFVAEAFTNPEFQKMLQEVKFNRGSRKGKSLWDSFLKAVGDLLGLKKDDLNALSQTIKATDDLLTDFSKRGDKDRTTKAKVPKKPKEAPPVNKQIEELEQRSEDILDASREKDAEGNAQEGGLSDGIAALKDPANAGKMDKMLRSIRNLNFSVLTTDNLTLLNMFDMMGSAGKMLRGHLMDASEFTAKLSNTMTQSIKKADEFVKAHRAEFDAEYDVDLEVATKFEEKGKSRDSGIEGEVETLKMTGFQRKALYMKIMDGLGKNKEEGKMFKHSSSVDIYKKDAGFDLNGRIIVLTRDQVQEIQQNPGILVSSNEMKAANMIWDGYRSIVGEANAVSQKLAGIDIMDPENFYYNPKHLKDVKGHHDLDLVRLLEGKLSKGRIQEFAKSVNARTQTGGFSHELRNPMDSVRSYQRSVSNSLGFAEMNIHMDKFMSDKKISSALELHYGAAWKETMFKFKDAFLGDRSLTGVTEIPVIPQLLSLRAQAILGYNPSVALKQVGSTWSAVATGKFTIREGMAMTKEALHFAKFASKDAKAEKATVIAEMVKHSAFFKQRFESGVIDIDLGDLAANFEKGSSFAEMTRGEIRKHKIGEMFLDKSGKINDARLKHLGDTMSWIRHMDEATMASIWNATKRKKFGDGGPKSKEDWESLARDFNEIALESQPTYNQGTRTFNQMRTGMLAKVFTQFSTQTARNWNIAYKHSMVYAKSEGSPADRMKLVEDMMPLLIQNAYIAAVTVGVAGLATSAVREALGGDENRRTRMDKAFPNTFHRYLVEYVNGLTGQVAGTGAITKGVSSALLGAPIYDPSIPIVTEAWSALAAAKGLDPVRFMKSTATLGGFPMSVPRTLGL